MRSMHSLFRLADGEIESERLLLLWQGELWSARYINMTVVVASSTHARRQQRAVCMHCRGYAALDGSDESFEVACFSHDESESGAVKKTETPSFLTAPLR